MMNANIRSFVAGAALLASAGPALAEDASPYGEISANVTMTTDYRFRGISQTDGGPAIQGGFDWSHDSGVYLGTWASNVDFAGSTEMDFYGGYAGDINEDLSFDVGVVWFHYPKDGGCGGGAGSLDCDYVEWVGGLSYRDFSFGVVYSNDFFAETGEYWYFQGDYALTLPQDFGLNFHLGWNKFNDAEGEFTAGTDTEDAYLDWSVTLSKAFMGVEWALQYNDTDLDEKFVGDDIADPTAIFSVTKSF